MIIVALNLPSLPYNQYAKGFEKMFKDIGIKLVYKTVQSKIFWEKRKSEYIRRNI